MGIISASLSEERNETEDALEEDFQVPFAFGLYNYAFNGLDR